MQYTPYLDLTDEELINTVINKEDATPLEIELMIRFEHALESLEDAEVLARQQKLSQEYVSDDA